MGFRGLAAIEKSDLPISAHVGFAEALDSARTSPADRLGSLEADASASLDDGVGGAALEHRFMGTPAGRGCWVIADVFALKPLPATLAGFALLLPGLVRIGFGEARLARAKAGVGNQRIGVQIGECLQGLYLRDSP